jgi:hypothetical protein
MGVVRPVQLVCRSRSSRCGPLAGRLPGMAPVSHPFDGQLDAATWCRHLVPDGSVYAFLADHRHELFPATVFADLVVQGRSHPSVLAEVVATVMVLQALEGLSDREAISALRRDIAWKVACGLRLRCPAGATAPISSSGRASFARECPSCPLRRRCTTAKQGGRTPRTNPCRVRVDHQRGAVAAYREFGQLVVEASPAWSSPMMVRRMPEASSPGPSGPDESSPTGGSFRSAALAAADIWPSCQRISSLTASGRSGAASPAAFAAYAAAPSACAPMWATAEA